MTNRNREIKFKIWNSKEKCMSRILTINQLIFNGYSIKEDQIILQFTGLKDSKGLDIYEGDIITSDTGFLMFISWSDGSLRWECLSCYTQEFVENLSTFGNEREIFGNIYQHPELLGEIK